MHALTDAYVKYRRQLLGVARLYGMDMDAEDAVQDTFLFALANERLDLTRPLFGYLKTAVKGRARTLRSKAPLPYRESPDPGISILTKIAASRLWEALTAPERLAVANLHILEQQVSRADAGLFASRIRLARQRLT